MNKIKLLFIKNNINFNIELIIFIIYNFLILLLALFVIISKQSLIFLLLDIMLCLIANVGNFYRLYFKIEKKNNELSDQAKSFFSYLYLDLNNKIALDLALTRVKQFVSIEVIDAINVFLKEIKSDSTSKPYIKLAKVFRMFDAEEMMLILYTYQLDKKSSILISFNNYYLNFKKAHEEDKILDNNNKFSLIKCTAIVGASLIVILLIASIIVITRGYING